MRIFVVAALSLFFTSSIAIAQDKGTKDPEPKTFKEAYAGYRMYEEPKTYNEKHLKTLFAEKAYEFGLKKFGKTSINTANLAINWVYSASEHSGDHSSPAKAFEDNIDTYKDTNKESPLLIIDAYLKMAGLLIKIRPGDDKIKRNTKVAISFINKTIKIAKGSFDENSKEIADLHLTIGNLYLYNYSSNKALKHLNYASNIYLKNKEKFQIDIALVNFSKSKYFSASKKINRAVESMQLALETFDKKIPSHQYALSGHAFMVQYLEKQGKSEEATKHCQAIGKAKPFDPNQDYLPVYKKMPEYPLSAARRGKQGHVLLEFTVDESGFVKDPISLEYSGSKSFIKSAIKALKESRYAPQFKNGKAVKTNKVTNLITFELAN